jgi:exopolysaccharide biosynthesis polyprenyl glycosylphosphotransferase
MYFILARIPFDFLSALLAWWLARTVRPITDLIPGLHSWFDPKFIPEISFFIPFSLLSAFGFVLISALFGSFRFSQDSYWSNGISYVLISALFWGMSIISFFAIVYREVIFSRIMLAQAMLFVTCFAACFRFLLWSVQKWCWKNGIGVTHVFLYGRKEKCMFFEKILQNTPEFSVSGMSWNDEKYSLKNSEEIWLVDEDISPKIRKTLREQCYQEHRGFRFLPTSHEIFARMDIQIFGGFPLLRPISASLSGWGQILKRFLDIAGSLFALIVFSPLFLLLGVGVWISSGRPIFYASQRIGKNGKEFTMWKFRSMYPDAEEMKQYLQEQNHRKESPFFKIKNDPRITPFGKFLRRYSLDEFPQFWNVLRGDMSLIGSRPHFKEEIQQFSPEKNRILSIKPGMTGLAQVSGRSDLHFNEEIRLDTYYLENWSFWLDVKILFKTIGVILEGKGAD